MQVTLEDIPAGLAGTDYTVKKMIALVRSGIIDPRLRQSAISILKAAGVNPADHVSGARALYSWIKSNVIFVNDPAGVESIQDPALTFYKLRAGDCDDHAILLAALCGSVGIPARFVTLGANVDKFSHVFVELRLNGEWVPADTTSRSGFGVKPPPIGVSKVYPISLQKGLNMPELLSGVRRDVAERDVRNFVWRYLSEGWQAGMIDLSDLQGYLEGIKSGVVEFSGSTFFDPVIKNTVNDFIDYVYSNGIQSNKDLTQVGLGSLSGFFGDLWNGVKKIVKPAAVVGATILGGPGAGAAAAGVLYSGGGSGTAATAPGYAGGSVSIPAGSGSVTYNPNQPYYPPSSGDSLTDLLKSPLVLAAAGVVLFLLLRKK